MHERDAHERPGSVRCSHVTHGRTPGARYGFAVRHHAGLSFPQAGSLKSATERRRSAASCARFPIDSAVWLAPCEVCAVIDWIVFIVAVMLVAAADCCCEALEMPSISAARLVDTFSISPSAVPASSARRAPATTSEVVCSIEDTASLVSD